MLLIDWKVVIDDFSKALILQRRLALTRVEQLHIDDALHAVLLVVHDEDEYEVACGDDGERDLYSMCLFTVY